MSVSKDEKQGTWTVYVRYTDWQGKRKAKHKRGFKTKREATEWERDFIASKSLDVNMRFDLFVDIYLKDKKPRIKYHTYVGKKYIIDDKILPYFGNKNLSDITTADVIQWQNTLLSFRDEDGKPYSQTYLRSIQNQLSAILNHACNYYDLKSNVSTKAGKMGKSRAKEMNFWTKKEFLQFANVMENYPKSYYAFQILFWCGIRVGELLALTLDDIYFDKRTLSITKSYQRINGKDIITVPKTEQSVRTIAIPKFIAEMIREYADSLYGIKNDERLFLYTKNFLHKEMTKGAKKSGVKRIRVHDLRNSHVAHLIELGFSPVAIASRLGHESIEVTYNYAHLYPSKQMEVADKLDLEASDE